MTITLAKEPTDALTLVESSVLFGMLVQCPRAEGTVIVFRSTH